MGYLVELHRNIFLGQTSVFNRQVFHGVDIYLVFDAVDTGTAGIGGLFQEERFFHVHLFFVHPYEHGFEVTSNQWHVVWVYQHFATGYIDFIFQCQGYRHRREGVVELAVVGNDAFYMRTLAGRKSYHFITFADDAGSYLPTETTEVEVWAEYILYRIAEVVQVMVVTDVYGFKEFQQGWAFVPWSTV